MGRKADQAFGIWALQLCLLAIVFFGSGCIFFRGQRYHHFTTRTPLPAGHYLILGFMGGREPWDNDKRGAENWRSSCVP